MFDWIGEALVSCILRLIWWGILFPVALVLCTPFILVRAAALALRGRQRFVYAISDGYGSVSDAWWRC